MVDSKMQIENVETEQEFGAEKEFYNEYLKKYLFEDEPIVPVVLDDNEILLEYMYCSKQGINNNPDEKKMRDAFAFYVSNGIIVDKDFSSKEASDLRIYINVSKLRKFEDSKKVSDSNDIVYKKGAKK